MLEPFRHSEILESYRVTDSWKLFINFLDNIDQTQGIFLLLKIFYFSFFTRYVIL